MPKIEDGDDPPWPGFYAPLYTQVPDELFDYWLPRLSEAELKVLLYIIRRTFGFKKTADDISRSQMVSGIVTREGRRLDYGAGVGATAIKGAIKGLLEKGLIDVQHNQSPQRGHEPTTYRLRLRATPDPPLVDLRPRGRSEFDQGEGTRNAQGLGQNPPPQETVQETESKRDPDAMGTEGEPPPYSPYLAQVVLDHARELGAETRGPTAVGEVLRLWVASGLREAVFAERLHTARTMARKGQGRGVDKWGLYLKALRDEWPLTQT